MNKHDIHSLIGKIKIKMKLIENSVLDKDLSKAESHISRVNALLDQLLVQMKDEKSCC